MVEGPLLTGEFSGYETPQERLPDRGTLGWMRDQAIETGRGVAKTFAAIPSVARDISPDSKWAAESQENFRQLDRLGQLLKTEKGQVMEETGRSDAGTGQKILEAIVTQAPAFAVGALTGGAGTAAMFAAQGYADARMQSEADIYGKTEKQLVDSNAKYEELRKTMSDADARKKLYDDSFSLPGQVINTLANAAGGYGLGRLTGRALNRAASDVTDGIIKRTFKGGIEGGLSLGGVSGAGEYARQQSQIGGGFRSSMDPDAILKQTLEGGEMGGILGGIAGAIPRRGATPTKPARKIAEPQGSEVMTTLAGQLDDVPGRPKPADWGDLQKHVDDTTREPGPFGPEGPIPSVEDQPEPPGQGAPYRPPSEAPNAPPPPPPAAATPAARAAEVPKAPPAPAAAPGPEATPFSREELLARANDVNQTPDHDTLLSHIDEWQKANPGQKLGLFRNVVQAQAKAARDKAAAAVKATEKAARAAAKKVQAAGIGPEVTPPGTPVEEGKIAKLVDAPGVTPPAATPQQEEEGVRLAGARAEGIRPGEAVAPEAAPAGAAAAETKPATAKPAEVKPAAEAKRPTLALTGRLGQQVLEKAKLSKAAREAEAKKIQEQAIADKAKGAGKRETDKGVVKSKRDTEAEQREDVAREIREAHAPDEDVQQENAGILKSLDTARGENIGELLKPVIERAEAQLKARNDKMAELSAGVKDPRVLRPFEADKKARTGTNATALHNYMVDLHNFVREVKDELRNRKFAAAKDRAKEHLEHEATMLEPGGAEKLLADKRKKSGEKGIDIKAGVVQRAIAKGGEGALEKVEKEVTEKRGQDMEHGGEGSQEDIERRAQEALEHAPPKKLKPPRKDPKTGRLIFDEPEAGLRGDYVGGREEQPNYDRQKLMQSALTEAKRKKGSDLTFGEVRDVLRRYDKTIEERTYGDLLPEVAGKIKNPVLREIYKHVFELAKDIPTTIWSRDSMDAFKSHINGPASRAFYHTIWGEGAFRHDTLVPRTIFHEAIHVATARAIRLSPRFQYMINQIQQIARQRYKNDPIVMQSLAFRRAIMTTKLPEFIAELFSRPELANILDEVKLKPQEMQLLWRRGYTPGRAMTLLKAVWRSFLEATGFRPRSPSLYNVSVDMISEMFQAEKKWQERANQRQEMLGAMNPREAANLQRRDPTLDRTLEAYQTARQHNFAVNELMDKADEYAKDPKSGEQAVGYLKDLNSEEYPTDWTSDEEVTPVSDRKEVTKGFLNFLAEHGGNAGKNIAFYAQNKPLERLRSNVGYGLTWTHKLGEVGEQGFREVMGKALDVLQKHSGFAAEYLEKGGDWESQVLNGSSSGQKLVSDLAELKHSIKDREFWERFERFMIRESAHTAYADEALGVGKNKHIDPNSLADEQTRQEHKELQDEWNYLKGEVPELGPMRDRLHEWGKQEQEARSRKVIADMAAHLDMFEPTDDVAKEAIVKRVRGEQDKLTYAEKTALDKMAENKNFEDNLKAIRRSRELVKLAGPYVPFMRRGQWQMLTKFNVKPDEGVAYKPIDPNPKEGIHEGYDFENLQDAKDFIKNKLNPDGIAQTGGHQIILDKRTGKVARIYTDEEFAKAEAEAKAKAEKANVRYEPLENRQISVKEYNENKEQYPNAQLHYRVTFNPKDYQLFDSEREAHDVYNSRAGESPDRMLTTEPGAVQDYRKRPNIPQTSGNFQRLINKMEASKSYQGLMDSDQAKIKRDLAIESMRIQTTSTRRARFLPRTFAKGASTDLLQNYVEFATSQAQSMADLEYRDRINRAMKEAGDYVEKMRYQKGHEARQAAFEELKLRAYSLPPPHNMATSMVGTALRVSQLGHLADLGYLAVNSTDNWVNALPVVGAEHGFARSAAELYRASRMFSPKEFAKAAFGDIANAVRGKEQTVKYEDLANKMIEGQEDQSRLSDNFRNLFQKRLISADAGMEVERLRNLDANPLGQGFQRVDGGFRAASTGVETHNRVSLATMAYRLAFDKTNNHELAKAYAEQILRKGAGDYSLLNRPRLTNNPWLRLPLQFRQFPMRIMSNYADAIMGSFDPNAPAAYRTQMRKQLAFMLATQSVVSGMIGLPWGPASGAVNAGYMLGMWDSNWDDVTTSIRQHLAPYTGDYVAEVLMHGLPRILGIDLSRMGQNSFIFNGSPSSNHWKDNLKTLGLMYLGAPGDSFEKFGTGIQEAIEAVHLYNSGAHSEAYDKAVSASGKIIQVKALSDIGRAYLQASGGSATLTHGGVPMGNEYTTYQAILRAIGITSSWEAEASEKRYAINRATQQERQQHAQALQVAVRAPDQELSSIWNSIQENFNAGRPYEQQIQFQDILKARAAAQRAGAKDVSGVGAIVSKKNRSFADQYNFYNTK